MKLHINKIWALAALTTAMSLASCSEKEDPVGPADGEGVEIGIRTNVTLNTKSALIEELKDGNEMNVWINVTGSTGATVSSDQLRAVNRGGVWHLDKTILLSKGQNADVYAVYPYVEGATDRTAVPVDVTAQEDVLYSGSGKYASYTSNVVTLEMKHAYSMVAVNVKKENYSGEAVISSMKIGGSDLIATKGKLNVENGVITPTESGELSADVSAVAGPAGINGALPAIWVAPYSSKDKSPVSMTLTIDGKDYTLDMPEVVMYTGWQYIFHAVLTSNGLVFVPDATEEYALNKADDQVGELTGHGIIGITYSGATFTFPFFTGDNVYGSIKAADGSSANYSIGGTMKLGSTAQQLINVETWNSTGFSFNSLEGIDGIDLSNY